MYGAWGAPRASETRGVPGHLYLEGRPRTGVTVEEAAGISPRARWKGREEEMRACMEV